MKIKQKIILPSLVLLALLLGPVVYTVFEYNIDIQILWNTANRFQSAGSLSHEIAESQNTIERQVLSYQFSQQRPNVLQNIGEADRVIAGAISSLKKIDISKKGKALLKDFIEKRSGIIENRTNFFNAIFGNSEQAIQSAFLGWEIKVKQINSALEDLEDYQLGGINRTLAQIEKKHNLFNSVLTTLIVVGGLVVFLSFFYYRRIIVQPIKSLDNLVKSYAGGSLEAKPSQQLINSNDELGDLAQHLTKMASELLATTVSRDTLGIEVKARQEAEERLSGIMGTAAYGIINIDERGIINFFNVAAEDIFGYIAKEVIGKNAKMLMPESFAGQHDKYISDYLGGGEAKIIGIGREVVGQRKDGSTFPLDLAISELRIGNETNFTGIVRDITDRKLAEQALSENQKRFEDFATSAFDYFWEMDENLRFSFVSDPNIPVPGYEKNKFIGKTRWEIVGADTEGDPLWRDHRKTIEAHKPFRGFEYEYIAPDGESFFWSVNGIPVFNSKGDFKGYRGTSGLITKRKKMEAQLSKLSSAVEQNPSGVIITDTDGTIEYVNPMFTKITGYSADEVIGQNPRILQSGLTPRAIYEEMWASLTSGKVWDATFQNKRKDGSLYSAKLTISPLRGTDGRISHYIGSHNDITVSDRIEKERKRLVHAVENLNEGIAVFDKDDRIVFTNKAFQELSGNKAFRELDEAIIELAQPGTLFEDHLRGVVRAGVVTEAVGREDEWMKDRMKHHRNPTKPIELLRSDGKTVLIKEQIVPDLGVVLVMSDITERKQVQEALITAKGEAERASHAKSQFLAAVSHELRTPLNAILGFSQILEGEYFGPLGNEKYKKYAEDIGASGDYLLSLVDDLLDISTIEAGKKSLEKEELSINEVINECVKIVDEKALNGRIHLITSVPEDLPLLYADLRATKQILLNLLSNSIKFTPEGGEITVSAKASKKNTTIKVADTGKGIPSDKLPELTNMFVRSERDAYVAEKGWGLGLSITKSLVDLHDGELDIKSKVGKGTTVTVTFPNGAS